MRTIDHRKAARRFISWRNFLVSKCSTSIVRCARHLASSAIQAKQSSKDDFVIPDTVKILLVLGLIAGAAYGSVWGLATFPPEQAEVLKSLPHDKLRQN